MRDLRGATGRGTRFRLFPQPFFLESYREPLVVELPIPPGSLAPGPADSRMYAIRPLGKTLPYGFTEGGALYLPPWTGPILSPPAADAQGHFDWLTPRDPRFLPAHAFACARFVLAVWERFLGPIRWHFADVFPRLEIVCLDGWDNGQGGFGFLELGENIRWRGKVHSFALNFDTIAHEMGHLLVFAHLGLPDPSELDGEYRGFHEAMADLLALVAAAHFDLVLDEVLEKTRGNLYVTNELGRFAELSASDQIRTASNSVTMSEFAVGWSDEHDLAMPLLGAFFDILVEIFQTLLVERGHLPPAIIEFADNLERMQAFQHPIDELYEEAFARDPAGFREALADARDILARYLAALLASLPGGAITYARIARLTAALERQITGGRFARAVEESFAWREIGRVRIGPPLTGLPSRSHIDSARTAVPSGRRTACGCRRRSRRRA